MNKVERNTIRRIGLGSAHRFLVALAVTGTLAAAACSDESTTGPEESGSVEAYMEDRSTSSAAAEGPARQTSSGEYSGSLTADARVEISADGSTWVDLGSPSSVAVDLQSSGEGTQVHGSVEVPADTYTYVRLTLADASADVAGGSTIGGLTLTGSISVALGTGGEVTIEKSVPPFEVRADATTRVTWNMNTHLWMDQETAEEEEVEEQEVENAAEPRTEETEQAD